MTQGRQSGRTPFWYLVQHFIRRLLSSDNEDGTGTVSLGLGAILAILASPGAFASIFLLDKYSTLLQWFRGQRIDPFRASVADEYFFIVLSMTITGLVMVMRWNHLFPDPRDFANLAILPIPIHHIFLANFFALLILAVFFGMDVNAVSSFLFPGIVTLSDGTLAGFVLIAVSHAIAVFCASLFSFFCVFALVGILLLVLPKRIFRRASLLVRIVLVIVLLTEFFSNLFLQLFSGRIPGHAGAYMSWLPSFWYLALYSKTAGLANSTMSSLASRALFALCVSICVALAAYTISYRSYFLRLAEFSEMTSIRKRPHNFGLGTIATLLSRSQFERGSSTFILHVLTRSERHLMFLGAYLGVGAVLVAQMTLDALVQKSRSGIPNSGVLAIPLACAFFVLSGLRFVFDFPAAAQSNWLFRTSISAPDRPPHETTQRLLAAAVIIPFVLIWTPLLAVAFGSAVAGFSGVMTIAIAILSIELLVSPRFQRIPFTCLVQSDTRQFVGRILVSLLAIAILVPMLASIEHWSLERPGRAVAFLILIVTALVLLRRRRKDEPARPYMLTFDERPAAAFELLKLV